MVNLKSIENTKLIEMKNLLLTKIATIENLKNNAKSHSIYNCSSKENINIF